jgi:mutator protein MutT
MASPTPLDPIPVVAAVVEREGRYFVGRRPDHKRHGGLWEFPGGKLDAGETWAEAAARELDEELGLNLVDLGRTLFETRDTNSRFAIRFVEATVSGIIEAREHSAVGWFTLSELATMPLAPSDAAFVAAILARLSPTHTGGSMSEHTNAWPDGAPSVGDRATRTRTIEAGDIERFTDISGDRNPLHYDPDFAARTRFGEIIVQGGVTSAILNAVVAEDLPGPGSVFLNVNWDFRAPVRPGDEVTGSVEVVEVRHDKPITKLRTTVTRNDGTVALEGTAVCYTMTPRTGG